MDYPHDFVELKTYLEKYPTLNVKFPKGNDTVYKFKCCVNTRVTFIIPSNGVTINFDIAGGVGGRLEYNADGFVRKMGPTIIAWFYYTGPKHWIKDTPAWQKKIWGWDVVLEGYKHFAD